MHSENDAVPGISHQRRKPPTIFLHIGTEKTGTTTIQAMAALNRGLLASHGLFYPVSPGKQNHVKLTLYALQNPDRAGLRNMAGLATGDDVLDMRDSLLDELRAEIEAAGCNRVLLSNEHLSSRLRHKRTVRRLIKGLREISRDIRVVVYLRPQYELILSAYSTAVKSGRAGHINFERSPDEHFYNYDKMLALWEEVLGAGKIIVRRFLPSAFAGGTLSADFFAAIGMAQPNGLAMPASLNRSLDANTLEYLRIANEVMPKFIDGTVNPNRATLVSALDRISTGPKYAAPAELLGQIDTLYADSNQAVAQRYFPGLERLFPPFEPDGAAPTEPLTVAQAVQIGLALWSNSRRPRARPARPEEEEE
jgi:hypothetical protein